MMAQPLSSLSAPPGFGQTTLFLALGQTLFWAATFYLLPALLLDMEQNSPWNKVELSAAMTGSMIVSALCARPAGQLIDAGYGKLLMVTGGIIAGCLLLICSQINSLILFFFCWLGIGACMAAILYEPCFSIVTRHHGLSARRVITHITLIAGFAGTVSYPIANWLAAEFDWRSAFQFFGSVVLFIATPLTLISVSRLEKSHPVSPKDNVSGSINQQSRRRVFWLITVAFTLGSINHTMVISHLLPLLNERGIAVEFAVIAAMLIGPMQVVGRFILLSFEKHISTLTGALICIGGLTCATGLLFLAGVELYVVYFATALHGATWGLVSITRPTLIREVMGPDGFGKTSGSVAAVAIFGVALAPTLGAAFWLAGGYQLMLGIGFIFAFVGGLLLWLVSKQTIQTDA